jgi:hypothetical protein
MLDCNFGQNLLEATTAAQIPETEPTYMVPTGKAPLFEPPRRYWSCTSAAPRPAPFYPDQTMSGNRLKIATLGRRNS